MDELDVLTYDLASEEPVVPPPDAAKPKKQKKNLRKLDTQQTIDHYGLLILERAHPQEEVVYLVLARAKHRPTRALFIGNIRRPVNAILFQNHLRALLADENAAWAVDRAWMNKTRTHAVVLFNQTEAAEAMRKALNGAKYPSAAERELLLEEFHARERARAEQLNKPARVVDLADVEQLALFVDYCQVGQIGDIIFEEDQGPKNGKWQMVYRRQGEHGEVEAEHLLLEGDVRPRRDKGRRDNEGSRRDARRDGNTRRDTRRDDRRDERRDERRDRDDARSEEGRRGYDASAERRPYLRYNQTRLRLRSPTRF